LKTFRRFLNFDGSVFCVGAARNRIFITNQFTVLLLNSWKQLKTV